MSSVQRCRDSSRQHPGEVDPTGTRNDGRRPWKRHAGFSNLDPDGPGATSEKRAETAQLRHAQFRQVHISGQHARQGGEVRRDRLLARGLQEIGASIEGEARPVFDQDLDPRGAREYMADPELNAGHRPEIA